MVATASKIEAARWAGYEVIAVDDTTVPIHGAVAGHVIPEILT